MNRRRIESGGTTWLMSSCIQCPFYKAIRGDDYCGKAFRKMDSTEEFPDWCPADKLSGAVQ